MQMSASVTYSENGTISPIHSNDQLGVCFGFQHLDQKFAVMRVEHKTSSNYEGDITKARPDVIDRPSDRWVTGQMSKVKVQLFKFVCCWSFVPLERQDADSHLARGWTPWWSPAVAPRSSLLQAPTIDLDVCSPEERQPKQLGQHSRSLLNTPGEGCTEHI